MSAAGSAATSTPSQAWAPAGVIAGYVLDAKGSKVPATFVTLYVNGSLVAQTYSGDENDGPAGEYRFSGLGVGNYSIRAEKADGIQFWNGTAYAFVAGDADATQNVTLAGYVFTPWLMPTPMPALTPTPTAVPAAWPGPVGRATPLPDNGLPGNLNPLYAMAVPPLVIAGLRAIRHYKKRPAAHGTYGTIDRSGSPSLLAPQNLRAIGRPGFSELYLTNINYSTEVNGLMKNRVESSITDIAMINRIDAIAKKYGTDQITIYHDIKRLKISIQRGRYR